MAAMYLRLVLNGLPAHTCLGKVQLCKTISHGWHGFGKVVHSLHMLSLVAASTS